MRVKTLLVMLTCLALPALTSGQNFGKAKLRQLLRDLADEAFENLVIQDPNRRVYGMAYEFKDVPDGPLIQDFGLDSMHDGAWLMSAMITAHRVDPEGGYLDRVQKFQAPFYINLLLNSDRLFPDMIPREGQERFDKPIKGWAPRGWDDGPGIDLVTAMKGGNPQPFSSGVVSHPNGTVVERDAHGRYQHAYFTSSHHLFQDLADGLLNVWLTTRDPDAAEAVRLIDVGRIEHGHRIPVVRVATGLMTGDERLAQRRAPTFDPARAFRPIWQGVVEEEKTLFGHYSDGLAWEFQAEIARSALSGEAIPDGFVLNAVGQSMSAARVARAFHGEYWQPGMTLQSNSITFEEGKLVRHADEHTFYNSRGIQFAWIGAALLPEFRERTKAWDEAINALSNHERQAIEGFAGSSLAHAQTMAELEASVDATIRHWSDVRDELGYLPRMIKANRRPFSWSRYMELGAYAHLMKLVAYRLMDLEGAKEVRLIREQTPAKPMPHVPLPDSVLQIQKLK
jgi:hypothetical protein